MAFVKSDPSAAPRFFEWEAAGLRWLSEAEARGGVRCVEVLSVSPGRIELATVDPVRPDAATAADFGRALAATHDLGADAFGAAPEGWDGPAWIGRRRMPCASQESWGRFYAEQRVRPFLATAVEAGNLRPADAATVERALERIAAGEFDDDEPPARLHGDLWTGNVLWSASGAVLIDPAAHGGHRETDLAMLALFGAPHLDAILAGYDDAHPLADGWEARVPLHQLHPLAVHAAGHGPSYGRALADAAARVLALQRPTVRPGRDATLGARGTPRVDQGEVMVDLGKLGRQAAELLQSQKAQEALRSEKAERVSDQVLEKTSDIASRLTKGKYDDRIEDLKRQADKRLGNE